MGIRELVCFLDFNSGPSLSLQTSSFFTSIYTDYNRFPHYHGPGLFLRLKKDLRESYRNTNYILTFFASNEQPGGLWNSSDPDTSHANFGEDKQNMCRVNFMGHAF